MTTEIDTGSKRWRDPNTLEELYHEEGLSAEEIGDKLGCSQTTVLHHMKEHGIERRQPGGWDEAPTLRHDHQGYERFRVKIDGVHRTLFHHRLLVVSEEGLDAVKDKHVHHKNGIPWDNRPENLEALTPEEHSQLHIERGDIDENGGPRKYTNQDLLDWIDAFVQEFGVVPSTNDIAHWPGPSQIVYTQRFGGIPDAVREAGYTPRSERGDSDE